jgi:hypothetical protein
MASALAFGVFAVLDVLPQPSVGVILAAHSLQVTVTPLSQFGGRTTTLLLLWTGWNSSVFRRLSSRRVRDPPLFFRPPRTTRTSDDFEVSLLIGNNPTRLVPSAIECKPVSPKPVRSRVPLGDLRPTRTLFITPISGSL